MIPSPLHSRRPLQPLSTVEVYLNLTSFYSGVKISDFQNHSQQYQFCSLPMDEWRFFRYYLMELDLLNWQHITSSVMTNSKDNKLHLHYPLWNKLAHYEFESISSLINENHWKANDDLFESSDDLYYMASSVNGQDEPNPAQWLATRAGKMEPSCPLWTNRRVPREKFPRKPNNKSFIDQVCSVTMAGYWPRSFFAVLWTSTSSRSFHVILTFFSLNRVSFLVGLK